MSKLKYAFIMVFVFVILPFMLVGMFSVLGVGPFGEEDPRPNGPDIDTDGDGLGDGVEQADSGPLEAADPLRHDIFIEVDYRGGDPEDFAEELEYIEQRFAEAPVSNPDGSEGISLHIVLDDRIDESSTVNSRSVGRGGAISNQYRDYRESGYHYAVIDATSDATSRGAYGTFFVKDSNNVGHVFMHELGHSLGITDENYRGVDSREVPPEKYTSVMNYAYIWGPSKYNDGEPFDDWEFIEDGYTPGRGGGKCQSEPGLCHEG